MAHENFQNGGCKCGQVRYHVTGVHNWAGNCHCDDCRRATGGPYSSWFGASPENFKVTKGRIKEWESSPGIFRGFCENCGSPLSFRGEGWNDIALTIASLDEPNSITPKSHVYLKERLHWVVWNEDMNCYDEFPEPIKENR